MSDTTIDTIFERWCADMASADFSRTKAAGDAFEHLCIAFLTHDPEQRLQYRNARKFADWAREHGRDATDTGIDLVAAIRRIVHLSISASRPRGSSAASRRSAPSGLDTELPSGGDEHIGEAVIVIHAALEDLR